MEPQIIKTKEAHKPIGGYPILEEVKILYPEIKLYPQILMPFRKTSKGDESYHVSVSDQTLSDAQAEHSLLN